MNFYKAKPAVRNFDAKIPELGEHGIKAVVASKPSQKRAPSSYETSDVRFKNAPYIVWVYTDHDKQNEIVCVSIPIISGARDVDFFLSDDNITLNVTYIWPSALCSPEELFKKQLGADGGWTMNHPKIHSFKTRLLELELTKNSQPEASIEIKLPLKVQREAHTYVKGGVKTKDGNVVMLEFQAFQKQHVIADADTKIQFE